MTKKKDDGDKDLAWLQSVMKDVKPLSIKKVYHAFNKKIQKQIPVNRTKTLLIPDWSDAEMTEVKGEEYLSFSHPSLSLRVVRQLKNGEHPIQASLDLHHYTVEQARLRLNEFIEHCINQSLRHVLIIHGKGSLAQYAKLKTYVFHWLKQNPHILAVFSALPQHGGTGALYVFIKKSK